MWYVVLGGIALYLAPTMVAAARRFPLASSVAVINVLFGWTIVGWVLAAAMAVDRRPRRRLVVAHDVGPLGPAPTDERLAVRLVWPERDAPDRLPTKPRG